VIVSIVFHDFSYSTLNPPVRNIVLVFLGNPEIVCFINLNSNMPLDNKTIVLRLICKDGNTDERGVCGYGLSD
jgi:hypothetical protein